MGYDIHITRARDWFEAYDNPDVAISAEEWLVYVENDPDLDLAGYNGLYFAIWSGECEYEEPWFDWSEGVISTKNPDDAILDKAVDIAKQLNAKVQGDDGEVYLGGGRNNFIREEDEPSKTTIAESHQRPWWRRLFG
ncbi:MAG: hypothetical protein AAF586_08010 [Planctomycetota bacterium]